MNLESRLTLYKSVIAPQLRYNLEALYKKEPKEKKVLKSNLYQCLKTLMNIGVNVKR